MLTLKNVLEEILLNDVEYYENKNKQFKFINKYYDENEILKGLLNNVDLYLYYEMTCSLKPRPPDRMIPMHYIHKQNNGERGEFDGGGCHSNEG